MFDKKQIDLIYRIICLLTFIIVFIFVKSINSLIILGVFFFLLTYKEEKIVYIVFYLLSFIFLCLGYVSGNYILTKLILILDYLLYFLNIPGLNELVENGIDYYVNNKKEKKERDIDNDLMDEEEYYRFKTKSKNLKTIKKDLTLKETLYIFFHLIILFISIMVG